MYVTYMYMCRYKLLVSCLNWYRIIIKVTYKSMEQVKCLTPMQSFFLLSVYQNQAKALFVCLFVCLK